MSFFDSLMQGIQRGESALGIGVTGHGSVYNSIRQNIVQPTQRFFNTPVRPQPPVNYTPIVNQNPFTPRVQPQAIQKGLRGQAIPTYNQAFASGLATNLAESVGYRPGAKRLNPLNFNIKNPADVAAASNLVMGSLGGDLHPAVGPEASAAKGLTPKPTSKLTAGEVKTGEALGMTKDQVTQTKTNMNKPPTMELPTPAKTAESIKPPVTQPEPLTPTDNKVSLNVTGTTDKQRVESAVTNSQKVSNDLVNRGQSAYNAGTKLSAQDLKLAEQYQHGVSIDALAQQAQNPTALKDFLTKTSDYYDFRLATDRTLGGQTPKRANYLRQIWDLSNPQDLARFNEYAVQKGQQKWNGFSAQPRVFDTYAQGEAAGFKRANPNILGDLHTDYNQASSTMSKRALAQGLQEAAPTKVSAQGMGLTPEGKPFINSNIPGLEGLSYHPDIHGMLKGYEPVATKDIFQTASTKARDAGNVLPTVKYLPQSAKEAGLSGVVGSLYDHSTSFMKHTMLNFSFFHSLNVGLQFAGASLDHPITGTKGLLESVTSYLSEPATQKIVDSYAKKGVLDGLAQMGVDSTRALPKTGLKALNPLSAQSEAIFNRELYVLKLNLGDQVISDLTKKGIPLNSPEARATGKEITMIMGEMNNKIMNLNPNTQKWFSRALLAPQFTEAKYSLLGNALTKGGAAGNLARKAVIGKSVVVGTLATLGTALATGKFPNLKQILLNYTTAPSIQTNLQNKKGHKLAIGLPQTYITEPAKPISGLLPGGNRSDTTHYLQARLNPALSDALSAYTNQDYYGNPIVDSTSNQSTGKQIVKNLGLGDLPIGIQQAVNAATGKQTVAQSALNTLGLPTKVDPNDPTSLYFKALDQTTQSLSDTNGDRAAFQVLHPGKDVNGNPIGKGPLSTQQTAAIMLDYPNVLAAERKFQLSQASHDPLWDRSPDFIKKVFMAQTTTGPVKSGDLKGYYNSPEYQQLSTDRNNFYSSLPTSTNTQSGVQQLQASLKANDPNLTDAQASTEAKRINLGLSASAPSTFGPSTANLPSKIKSASRSTGISGLKLAKTAKGRKPRKMKVISVPKPKTITLKGPKYHGAKLRTKYTPKRISSGLGRKRIAL